MVADLATVLAVFFVAWAGAAIVAAAGVSRETFAFFFVFGVGITQS